MNEIRKNSLVVGSLKIIFAALVWTAIFSSGNAHALYSTAYINSNLDAGVGRAFEMDNECRNYLSSYRSSSYKLRQIINGAPGGGGASYNGQTWLSAAGRPNNITPTTVAYGSTSVDMQVNSMSFLCASLVAADLYPSTTTAGAAPASAAGVIADDNSRWVTPTDANDRFPNAIGSTNMRPALVDVRTLITRFDVTGGSGTINFASSNRELRIYRDNTSRYWFAGAVPVTYTTPPIITPTTINVRMYFQGIASYHALSGSARRESCYAPSGALVQRAGLNSVSYGECEEQYYDLSLELVPEIPDLCSNIPGTQYPAPTDMDLPGDGTCRARRTCGGLNTSGAPDESEPFTFNVNFGYTGLITPSPAVDSINVVGPGPVTANNVPFTASGGTITSSQINASPLPYGPYSVTYTLSGPDFSAPITCTETLVVGRKPYFKAYGGDIFTGGSFKRLDGTCDDADVGISKGRLLGNFKLGKGGAGTQLAAIAMMNVDGVASADLRTLPGPSPVQPSGLTFANTAPVAGTDFGGKSNFSTDDAKGYCAPDYFTDMQYDAANSSKIAINTSNGIVDLNNDIPNGTQLRRNPGGASVKVKPGGLISNRSTLFVDGDVIITDNIEYSTGWGSLNTIPYLSIIVRGNIYVGDNVKQMDGLYIAQPRYDSTGTLIADSGRIYTCRKSANGNPITLDVVDKCKDKLTVRGALIAQRIVLQRTTGTLKDAALTEGKGSANVAEEVNYTPEFFLGKPVFKTKANKPDSIKSLPPTL
ncbi:hypothetical protein H7Y63_02290 [Polaromonas sp.]|nr:hypothetical protein [Candidatus Saccharibacteria bacterium]